MGTADGLEGKSWSAMASAIVGSGSYGVRGEESEQIHVLVEWMREGRKRGFPWLETYRRLHRNWAPHRPLLPDPLEMERLVKAESAPADPDVQTEAALVTLGASTAFMFDFPALVKQLEQVQRERLTDEAIQLLLIAWVSSLFAVVTERAADHPEVARRTLETALRPDFIRLAAPNLRPGLTSSEREQALSGIGELFDQFVGAIRTVAHHDKDPETIFEVAGIMTAKAASLEGDEFEEAITSSLKSAVARWKLDRLSNTSIGHARS